MKKKESRECVDDKYQELIKAHATSSDSEAATLSVGLRISDQVKKLENLLDEEKGISMLDDKYQELIKAHTQLSDLEQPIFCWTCRISRIRLKIRESL
jgi:hypothetical protein